MHLARQVSTLQSETRGSGVGGLGGVGELTECGQRVASAVPTCHHGTFDYVQASVDGLHPEDIPGHPCRLVSYMYLLMASRRRSVARATPK